MNIDYYDPTIKDEIERLNQTIIDHEGENSCNQLLIQKLEDKVTEMRKCNDRIVSSSFAFIYYQMTFITQNDRDMNVILSMKSFMC